MGVRSGSAALDEAWVQADVSYVMPVQQPGEETLQAQTITSVRACAILSLKRRHGNVRHLPMIAALLVKIREQR